MVWSAAIDENFETVKADISEHYWAEFSLTGHSMKYIFCFVLFKYFKYV